MRLEEAVDAFLGEWLAGLPPYDAGPDWYRERLRQPHALLFGAANHSKIISCEADRLLWVAADLLLEREGEQRRVERPTARKCLLDAHEAHLGKARKQGTLSEHAIVAGAKARLARAPRNDGTYAIPIRFAPSAKITRFRIGPALILSSSEFMKDFEEDILKPKPTERFSQILTQEWTTYASNYDHFIMVDVKKHECAMAWKSALDVAEYVLNIFRIRFGFLQMHDVRTGNGFVWETSQSRVYFDEQGHANLSLSKGPWASHLDDSAIDRFENEARDLAPLFASLAYWMVSGEDHESPVLERLRYANVLLAEAFCEPHDRIRLIRLVAALEALAALPRGEKANSLAWRCAFAGGWADCGRAVEIVNDILHAYQIRNEVVHGDAPPSDVARSAFRRVERHLSRIYLGYLTFYAKVQQRYRPTHTRQIRRAFSHHIEYFFWDPEDLR